MACLNRCFLIKLALARRRGCHAVWLWFDYSFKGQGEHTALALHHRLRVCSALQQQSCCCRHSLRRLACLNSPQVANCKQMTCKPLFPLFPRSHRFLTGETYPAFRPATDVLHLSLGLMLSFRWVLNGSLLLSCRSVLNGSDTCLFTDINKATVFVFDEYSWNQVFCLVVFTYVLGKYLYEGDWSRAESAWGRCRKWMGCTRTW